MAPPKSSSFSVRVVLPASGWAMMAKVRRRATALSRDSAMVSGIQFEVARFYQSCPLLSNIKVDPGRAGGNRSIMTPRIALIRLPHGEDLPLPAYETEGAAGMDLRAAIPADRAIVLTPGRRVLVPTGFIFEIPPGYEGQVRPRSGLA